MAALPPLDKIVATHGSTYDALFRMADTAGNGIISAMEAAAYMKKSGLSEHILSHIWEMADAAGKGYLDKHTFSVAMKLIAVAQTGQEATSASLTQLHPPPNMGPLPENALVNPASTPEDGWSIPTSERTKYNQIFTGLLPVNGLLSGDKVKPVLLNSKLPMDILGRVWDMSDVDGDGFLDQDEFSVAMHLVYKALEKEPVPVVLPPDMIPPSKRKPMTQGPVPLNLVGIGAEGRSSPALGSPAIPGVSASGAIVSWVITPSEQAKYDDMFTAADLDKDGFVNGIEIKDIFIQSGVPQTVLAHIWNLCDGRGLGKLNKEQFALAMYLIQQRLAGIEPPQQLPGNMIPPSMRPSADPSHSAADAIDSSGLQELDNISKEIDGLKQEKMGLENEKAQKEADIRIRKGEVAALQKELDAINSTVSQLQMQKGEAQKRLDELEDKKVKLESDVKENKEKCQEEILEISKFKTEIAQQASLAQNREAELHKLQNEFTSLRQEESGLEKKLGAGKTHLDQLASSLSDTNKQVNQARSDIEKLKEAHAIIQQAIEQYSKLIAGDTDASEPALVSMELFSTKPLPNTSTPARATSIGLDDPFASKDPFSNGDTSRDPFVDDPFKGSDPFGATSDPFGGDPFANESNFSKGSDDAFSSPAAKSDPFESTASTKAVSSPDDPWAAAFSSSAISTPAKNDPFGAFGDTGSEVKSPPNPADPFGTGAFTTNSLKPRSKSPAPPRPKSPAAPSLPPKQKKAPPPPRPPMPSKAKSPVPGAPDPFEGQDPFGAPSLATNDPFADFADFNSAQFPSPASSSPAPSAATSTAKAPPSSTEAEQLAWATRHSQEEADRQRQLADQERADLEMAIALSKAQLSESSEA